MSRWLIFSFVLIALLSCGVIYLLLNIQYIWGEPFFDTYGEIDIWGRTLHREGSEGGQIVRAVFNYNGLSFNLRRPVRFRLIDGSEHTVDVISYDKRDNDLIVRFQNNQALLFHVLPEQPENLVVSLQLNDTFGSKIQDAILYFSCARFSECVKNGYELSITRGERDFTVLLPPDGNIQEHNNQIRIPATKTQSIHVLTTEQRINPADIIAAFPSAIISDTTAHEALKQSFIDRVYMDIQQTSYLPASGQWINRNGDALFDEHILIMNLCESLARDQYLRTYNTMRRSAVLHKEQTTLRSIPYLGDSLYFLARLRDNDDILASILERTDDYTTVLNNQEILEYAAIRAGYQQYTHTIERMLNIDYLRLSLTQLIALLTFAIEVRDERLAYLSNAIYSRIIPPLVTIYDNLYLASDPHSVDLLLNLQASRILEGFAQWQNIVELLPLARALELSVLSLADDSGYVPATLNIRNQNIISFNGHISPATLYPLLFPDRYYPRLFRLVSHESEHQKWLLTHQKPSDYELAARRVRIQVPSSGGGIFHILIGNLTKPRSVSIDGRQYANNADFENFLQGRYWSADSETLIIRYQDNDNEREIVVEY